MTRDDFKNILEEQKLDEQQLQEVLYYFDQLEIAPEIKDRVFSDEGVKMAILREEDWRTKAALAASLVSKGLEE